MKISSKFIYQTEGIKGFWRGTDAMILKLMLSSSIFYASLHELQSLMKSQPSQLKKNEHIIDFFSAFFSRIISSLMTNPMQVVRTRVEVIGFNEYSGPIDGLRKVYKLEGLHGFGNGALTTVLREGPFAGIYYVIYKLIKNRTKVK